MSDDINPEQQQLIRKKLNDLLEPVKIEVIDDSKLHRNHAEAKKHGGGHFRLFIVSPLFSEKTEIERHRMIYVALGDSIGQEIHALSIKALSPEEYCDTEMRTQNQ